MHPVGAIRALNPTNHEKFVGLFTAVMNGSVAMVDASLSGNKGSFLSCEMQSSVSNDGDSLHSIGFCIDRKNTHYQVQF
jgi:hypothetical protein